MSIRVGLDASQADLDVQGEIDFDFFEESDVTNSCNTVSAEENLSRSTDTKQLSENYVNDPNKDTNTKEADLSLRNIPESYSSNFISKPLITVSCDDITGIVQKTTIETIIPTPYNYKDNKCGKISPCGSKKGKRILSPRLKSKIFNDDHEISDDSSISSMSESDSELSNVSDDSFDLNEETDSMTDVSPLMSPYACNSPIFGEKKETENFENESKEESSSEVTVDNEKKECSKCNEIDIKELVKAVKRLEMKQNINVCRKKCPTPPILTQNAKCRRNLSFTNKDVLRIDNDNRNLLKKIIAQQNRPKPNSGSPIRHVSSASVNRQRQQRQIELENLALLKRLESTKASHDLRRTKLLREYDNRSAAVLSRATSRSSKSTSHNTSCRTSAASSGRTSAITIKSTNSLGFHTVSSNKH